MQRYNIYRTITFPDRLFGLHYIFWNDFLD